MTSMATTRAHGTGHYSEDGLRWWDNAQRRWFVVADSVDTLHVDIEHVTSVHWPPRLGPALFTRPGAGYYRFVAQIPTDDPADPIRRIISPAFPSPHGRPRDGEPEQRLTAAARHCLRHLSACLIESGWQPLGDADSRTYVRPTLIAVSPSR